ncbi:glutamine amidotransferase [Hyphomonas sp.]|uniref:glutamine amidotransferase n=1 Tax=Hyphomonas sp. TaxID=87 RepID=UPI003526D18D
MIEAVRIGFDPFLGWPALWAVACVAVLAWLAYIVLRGRAWLTRGLGLTLLAAALSNPSLVHEEREPLPSVAAVVLDRSESMDIGDRAAAARKAYDQVQAKLAEDPSLEVRVLESDPNDDGTHLYSALEGLMADVPRDRIAGAILITDGQLHDVPGKPDAEGVIGPVHGLIVGDPDRGDRRVELVEAPSFGIVGETADLIVRVDDPDGGDIDLDVSVNGGIPERVRVKAGEATPLPIKIERRGENIVVVEAPPGRQELTMANNRTAASLAGVRDRLRVLLVTGKPNQAGRTWRDLLKSDPSVDLVHFTILRPPYKSDNATEDELALIAFPTEELFEAKLTEFDLIIFDQYERRGVITQTYLANMARYVTEGGALLIAAGEDFAGPASLARSPLASVLPAVPTGVVRTGEFVPELTNAGKRHAVTAPLEGRQWGSWMRYIESTAETGDTVLAAPDGKPLLVLDRVGKGRVGMLMSDQIWLWARGYDGGGPFAETIRRVVHWLMKEPELEERRLKLTAEGDTAHVELRSLMDTAPPLQIETPEGETIEPGWTETGPGIFTAEAPIDQLGLYRARAGGLETVALNGPANPKEYADLQSTIKVLQPLARATGGGVFRLNADDTGLPDIRRSGARGTSAGGNWLGLRERGAYAVRSSSSQALLPGIAAAALLVIFLLLAWRREGR